MAGTPGTSSVKPTESTPLHPGQVQPSLFVRFVSAFKMMRVTSLGRQTVGEKTDEYTPIVETDGVEAGSTTTDTSFLYKPYFNLTVCIIASALLSMPFGFDKAGAIGGFMMLAAVGIVVDYTLVLLGRLCVALNIYDYQNMAEFSFGSLGRVVQALVQLCLSLSLMTSYQIIAAENLNRLLRSDWVNYLERSGSSYRLILVIMLTVLILVPLATTVTLKVLGYSSMISVIAIFTLAFSLLYFDVAISDKHSIQSFNGQFMTGISVFATGFVCHQIITPTLDGMAPGQGRLTQFKKVVHAAVMTSFVIFATVGIGGYYLCYEAMVPESTCPGNILEWDGLSSNVIGSVAICMFLVTALFAYPIEHFSCYNTIEKVIAKMAVSGGLTWQYTLVIKLLLILITTIPAVLITDIGPLIAWAGDLSAFPLGFILPLAMAVKNKTSLYEGEGGWQTYCDHALLVFTSILMVYEIIQEAMAS